MSALPAHLPVVRHLNEDLQHDLKTESLKDNPSFKKNGMNAFLNNTAVYLNLPYRNTNLFDNVTTKRYSNCSLDAEDENCVITRFSNICQKKFSWHYADDDGKPITVDEPAGRDGDQHCWNHPKYELDPSDPGKPLPSMNCGELDQNSWHKLYNTYPRSEIFEYSEVGQKSGQWNLYKGACVKEDNQGRITMGWPNKISENATSFGLGFVDPNNYLKGLLTHSYAQDYNAKMIFDIQQCRKNKKCELWKNHDGVYNDYLPLQMITPDEYKKLMLHYCLNMSTSNSVDGICPFATNKDGDYNNFCPNYLKKGATAGNPDGNSVCKEFMEDPANADAINAILKNYCKNDNFIKTTMCNCLSAPTGKGNLSNLYSTFVFKGNVGINTGADACWFPPCQDTNTIRTTDQYMQDKSKCPKLFCENLVQENLSAADIIIANQICEMSGSTGSSTEKHKEENHNEEQKNETPTTSASDDDINLVDLRNKIFYVIGFIMSSFVIIYFVLKKRNS